MCEFVYVCESVLRGLKRELIPGVTGIYEPRDMSIGKQLLFSVRAVHALNNAAISPDPLIVVVKSPFT